MTVGGVRVVTRLARRTALREWRRTALIAALVMVCVATALLAAGVVRASQVTPEEAARDELGQAQLGVTLQTGSEAPATVEDVERVERLLADLPDADVVGFRQGWSEGLESAAHPFGAWVTDLPVDAPLTEGMFHLKAGRAPQAPGEVAMSPAMMEDAGVAVGDTLTLSDLGPVEVVGRVVDPLAIGQPVLVVTPPDLPPLAEDAPQPFGHAWLVGGVQHPVATASELADAFTTAEGSEADTATATMGITTRDEILEWAAQGGMFGGALSAQLVATFVAAVLLAEVALIAGAAYATGARRRLRELGLLGANGATATHLRGAVVGEAATTGLLGALVGVGAGVAGLLAGRDWIERATGQLMQGLELSPSDAIGPVLAGVVAVAVAAWLPARTAAAVPTTTALQGRMPLAQPKRWIVPVGVVLAGFGSVLFLVGAIAGGGTAATGVAVTGVLIAVGGTALLTIPTVALLGRFAHRLPVTWRLVLRDSARQRTRAAAACASAMVVLMVPLLISTVTTSLNTNDLVLGLPTPDNHVWVAPPADPAAPAPDSAGGDHVTRDDVLAHVRDELPEARHASVTVLAPTVPVAHDDRFAPLDERAENGGSAIAPDAITPTAALATPDLLAVLDAPGAVEAVEAGFPVVLGVRDRDTTIHVDDTSVDAVEVAVPVLRGAFPRVLIPPEDAAGLGLDVAGHGDLFVTDDPITPDSRSALYAGAGRSGVSLVIGFDRGPDERLVRWAAIGGALLVALVILALITMLSATESDRDLRAMVAVGAAPRLRRRFLGLQSGVHSLIGAALATPLAVALSWAALGAGSNEAFGPFGVTTSGRLWLDWPALGIVLIGVPSVIAAVIGLLVRSARTAPPRSA